LCCGSPVAVAEFRTVKEKRSIESKALQALVERLREDPNNGELKTEIRNFDLLARKAYFNSQWQVKTGAYLLLFGAVVLALALRVYYSLKLKIEQPDRFWRTKLPAGYWLRKESSSWEWWSWRWLLARRF
jgi:hypothetical protein